MDDLFKQRHHNSCRLFKLKRGPIIGDREGMTSKGRELSMLGLFMGFKTRHVVRFVYILVVLLFIVTFFGNIVSIRATIPWHTDFFHLVSLSHPTKSRPLQLADCRHVNVTTFEKTLMMYTNDDSLHQNVTNISRIKKIFLENEQTLSRQNQRLVSAVKGNSSVEHIHSIFRDILLTRAIQNSYKAEAAKDILQTVKIPMDEHYRKRRSKFLIEGTTSSQLERYESCAVVGNSGVLQNSLRGLEIDKHQVVIRLNNAVPRHLNHTMMKAHIGAKTTLTFMNSHVLHQCLRRYRSCNCHPYGVEVPIMVYLCVPDHVISVACCSFEHQTPLFLTDGRFDAFVSRVALWYSLKNFLNNGTGTVNLTEWENAHKHEFHYSSGFQAVIVALALCEKVDLYGFGKHPKARHHFHSNQRREHYAHDFEGEYLFYDDLEANRLYENPFLCQAGISIPEVQVFH